MSFITRCPACATAFKVVPDQLKISDGWVRCGQCQAVFDATLDLQAVWGEPLQAANVTTPAPAATENPVAAGDEATWSEPVAPGDTPGQFAWPGVPTEPVSVVGTESPLVCSPSLAVEGAVSDPLVGVWTSPVAESAAPQEPGLVPDPTPETAVPAIHVPDSTTEPLWGPASAGAEEEPLSFVRQAQRRAWWHRTPVRVLVGGLVVALLLGLLAQWVWWERDHLAARSPVWRATLERLCEPLGCRINDWQAPDQVHIESSALLRRAPGRYVFDLVLKNTSPWAVALPAIELTLTDATDAVLVRRVLPRQDWSPHVTVVPGMAEQGVRLELVLPPAEAQLMTGYRALLFYP